MADREAGPRPGGRSARVQASVHRAVRELFARMERAEVTIPLIAQEAGVTPSTIYRRWGELNELLADVAVERLRPDMVPVETGSGRGDLLAWTEQYAEEMASSLGREMIRDVLAAEGAAGPRRCCAYARQQIAVIADRAAARGEAFPDLDAVLDRVIAPILFRILFDEALATEKVAGLVECAFAGVGRGPEAASDYRGYEVMRSPSPVWERG